MASGEFFMTKNEKKEEIGKKKRENKEVKKLEKIERQAKLFEAPEEDAPKQKANKT